MHFFYLFSELHGDEDDCRKTFKMMKSSHIGLHHPEFFLHWANFELQVDKREKSLLVLSSANDTPIMRGNLQIKEAKELIESDKDKKDLKLNALFNINFTRNQTAFNNFNFNNNTSLNNNNINKYNDYPLTPLTNGMLEIDHLRNNNNRAIDLKFNGEESLDEKLMKIRCLGPPKRIKGENIENEQDKENFLTIGKIKKERDTGEEMEIDKENKINNLNNTQGLSENSNMSLTMTEINVNIIEETRKTEIIAATKQEEEIAKTIPFNETGTLNFQSNNTINSNNNNTINNNNNNNNNKNNSNQIKSGTTSTIRSRQVKVNGKVYRVLQIIGRGGSSKVFRVIDGEGQIYALKKVNLKNLDEITQASYTNEISLLKSFAKNPHIIQLIDSEMNKEQACLYILMEYGEVDLGKMLKNKLESNSGSGFDDNFIRFSFQQV